jgi:NDP-sugar pyrophosphorylase family protein
MSKESHSPVVDEVVAPQAPTATLSPEALASTAAIVLAGSYAWTGSSFDQLRARPLLPIGQSPMIAHVLGALKRCGVAEATICANGSTGAMKAFFEASPQLAIGVTFYEDPSPRGAAGCLRDAAEGMDADTFIVTECAMHPDISLEALVQRHRERGAAMTIAVSREEGPGATEFLNPTGLYIVDRRVLNHISAQGYQDLKENLIPQLHAAGELVDVFVSPRGCPTVLNAQSYLAANQWMVQRLARERGLLADESEYQRTAEVIVHVTAHIDATASLVGPVLVGPGVEIRAGAVVIGPTALGAGTVVGRNVAVSRSVIWNNAHLGDDAIVDKSIVADRAAVPAGAQLQGAVHVSVEAPQGPLASWWRRAQVAVTPRERPVPGLAMSSVR